MQRQSKTKQESENWPSIGHPSNQLSRTNALYWRNRLNKTISQSGAENQDYSVRIHFKGRRARFPLHSPNKQKAANLAAEIYRSLLEEGWAQTLKEYKDVDLSKTSETTCLSVGEFIKISKSVSTARETSLNAYSIAFRRIVADIIGGCDRKIYDHNFNITPDSLLAQEVDATPLERITPLEVQKWKTWRLNQASFDRSSKRHTTVTVNSLLRNARALFAKKLLPFLREAANLPTVLPFDEIQLEKSPDLRYKSKIDPSEVMELARQELKNSNLEVWKAFLLAFVFGLRISEIDWLRWEDFDFEECTLDVVSTEYHQLKSDSSEGTLNMTTAVRDEFKELSKEASNHFVIESASKKKHSTGSGVYRCKTHFISLRAWLRKNGVNTTKPIHTLRKEIGSMIASKDGIYAASSYLRHSHIAITSAFYTDQKNQVTAPITI